MGTRTLKQYFLSAAPDRLEQMEREILEADEQANCLSIGFMMEVAIRCLEAENLREHEDFEGFMVDLHNCLRKLEEEIHGN